MITVKKEKGEMTNFLFLKIKEVFPEEEIFKPRSVEKRVKRAKGGKKEYLRRQQRTRVTRMCVRGRKKSVNMAGKLKLS